MRSVFANWQNLNKISQQQGAVQRTEQQKKSIGSMDWQDKVSLVLHIFFLFINIHKPYFIKYSVWSKIMSKSGLNLLDCL